MDAAAVASLIERVGLPVAILAALAFLAWRLGGRLLEALVAAYSSRIAGLEKDRDHFRDRAEAADDRMNGLCRELIDEYRTVRLPPGGDRE